MKDGGRLSAAIDILAQVMERHRPVQAVLRDWGINNRYAGSKDRTFIRNLIFDALRRKLSISWQMNSDTPRSIILGTYVFNWEKNIEELRNSLSEDKYSPPELSESELNSLSNGTLSDAPEFVRADVPEWLWSSFTDNFDEEAVTEGCALSCRPPIDIRVNTLKCTREKLLSRLSHFDAKPTPISPLGIRIQPSSLGKIPRITSETGYQKGWMELQDESSQIATILVNAKPGGQVLDYCAGGGGKTLALAAEMENKGQIYAFDSDKSRLSHIHQRLIRAGVRNVQVRTPDDRELSDLENKMSHVLVDAPCSGTGVWRRRPDAKWRITENALAERITEQETALKEASRFVKPGGWLVYATCSVLAEENEQQIYAFVDENPNFEIVSVGEVWQEKFGFEMAKPWSTDMMSVTLTPATTGTDGFFISVLVHNE